MLLYLKDYNGDFRKGELVVQKVNGVEVFRARVVEWRFGSRLLKLENVVGIIRENVAIESYQHACIWNCSFSIC